MKHYGLIGYPLGHSFSKRFFTEKFSNENIEAQYESYSIEKIDLIRSLISDPNLSGLNVTIPYKEQIIPFLTELDAEAEAIGAVNVIKFIRTENGLRLKGYNSDAIGFETSLHPYLKPNHKRALILGTGGASKAIRYVLNKLGIETTYVSRTPAEGQLSYKDLDAKCMSTYSLIINASPLGTYPNIDSCPNIPYEHLTPDHLLYDVVYNPAETLFLKKGREMGATGLNGEQMLVEQALAAWKIWNE
ncbi:MAG: shikimate dehydrogenase [Paludibacter sp.]|nr:shikimate dehydrogenase [Paludibacter sp.]